MKPIRSPSVETLRKQFKISLPQAKTIKEACSFGDAVAALKVTNLFIGGYGVESLYPEAPHIHCVNMCDAYSKTLLYNRKLHYMWVGSWGDWAEKNLRYK